MRYALAQAKATLRLARSEDARVQSMLQAGDAVPHMELTGVLFLPGDQGLLLWDKTSRNDVWT